MWGAGHASKHVREKAGASMPGPFGCLCPTGPSNLYLEVASNLEPNSRASMDTSDRGSMTISMRLTISYHFFII